MIPSVFGVLLLLEWGSVSCQVTHVTNQLETISATGDFTFDLLTDGEGVVHADFNKQQSVSTLPVFADPISSPGVYGAALSEREVMKAMLDVLMKSEKDLPEVKEAPVVVLYPEEDVEVGVSNSLVCFVNQFYPPLVRVTWSRNNQEVTEGAEVGRFFTNSDQTFYTFATLDFTPQVGDVYSCSVEHVALDSPETRIWEPEGQLTGPSVGPAVFCGLGLVLGLLGVAAGTIFLVKGNQCQ